MQTGTDSNTNLFGDHHSALIHITSNEWYCFLGQEVDPGSFASSADPRGGVCTPSFPFTHSVIDQLQLFRHPRLVGK